MSSAIPEIRRTKIEVTNPNDVKELKKLFDSLSEFGFRYEYVNKKNRIIIRGEIDWCDDEFIGIRDNDIEMGVSNFKKYSVIRLRQRYGENIKIKDIYLRFPVKFSYYHRERKLVLNLAYEEIE